MEHSRLYADTVHLLVPILCAFWPMSSYMIVLALTVDQ